MRTPEYISPTSMKKYFDDREEWYIKYISDHRIPREGQTQAMSIGSAFDAYVKSYLHNKIFGTNAKPEFELRALFEKQVEKHNWDWAWEHGDYAFKFYKACGALADLALELDHAVGDPHFEIDIQGMVGAGLTKQCPQGIMLLGKPDVFFRNREGHVVILDWKVNGWCSKGNTSPAQGYIRTRDSVGEGKQHKKCTLKSYQGMTINGALPLEAANEDWAAQLATYGWLVGAEIGEEFITCIDQFACKNNGTQFPGIRVAEHRTVVSKDFQNMTFSKYVQVQESINSGHVFTDLSFEDSQGRCKILDMKCQNFSNELADGRDFNEVYEEIFGPRKMW